MDPELGINIVDLGLIYEVKIEKGKPKTPAITNAKQGIGKVFGSLTVSPVEEPKTFGNQQNGAHVEARMTLTSIGCPLAGFFAMQVEEKIKSMKGVKDVHVHIVWEPGWTPERMSGNAKATLGFK